MDQHYVQTKKDRIRFSWRIERRQEIEVQETAIADHVRDRYALTWGVDLDSSCHVHTNVPRGGRLGGQLEYRGQVEAMMKADFEKSKLASPAEYTQRGLPYRFLVRVCRLLAPVQ